MPGRGAQGGAKSRIRPSRRAFGRYDEERPSAPPSSSSADSLTFFMTQYFLRRLRSPMRHAGAGTL